MILNNTKREVKKIRSDTCAIVINSFKERVQEGKRQMDRQLENIIKY